MENTLPKRKITRIQGYNYSQNGYYFVTLCTRERKRTLSKIENGKIILYENGKIVKQEIQKTNIIRENVSINNYVVMPNHIHMIIEISNMEIAWHAIENNKKERGNMILPKVIQQIKVVTQKLSRRVAYHATPTVAKRIL